MGQKPWGMQNVEIPETGFFYYDPKHKYFLNGEAMTGVTTPLDGVGDKSNLIQWAANQSAAIGIIEGASMNAEEFAKKLATFKKLDTAAAQQLDKLFPGFKAARTASNRIKDKAADSGKEAHKLCELFERGELTPRMLSEASEEGQRRFNLYKDWYENNIEKTLFVERPLFSSSLFLGGTPDGGFVHKDGRNLINDKKFKPSIWDPTAFRQMAAYRLMLEEMAADITTPVRIDWGDGKVEEYASPLEYLGSFGGVKWDGAVVIRVGEYDFEEMYADTYETDKRGFLAALEIYRENGAFKNRVATITN